MLQINFLDCSQNLMKQNNILKILNILHLSKTFFVFTKANMLELIKTYFFFNCIKYKTKFKLRIKKLNFTL